MKKILLSLCVLATLAVSAQDSERVRVKGLKNVNVIYHPYTEMSDKETEYFQKAVPGDDGSFLLPDDGKAYTIIVMPQGGEENGYPLFYLLPGEKAVVTGNFREPGWYDYTITGPAAYDEMMKHREKYRKDEFRIHQLAERIERGSREDSLNRETLEKELRIQADNVARIRRKYVKSHPDSPLSALYYIMGVFPAESFEEGYRMLSPQVRAGEYAQMLRIKYDELKKHKDRLTTEQK